MTHIKLLYFIPFVVLVILVCGNLFYIFAIHIGKGGTYPRVRDDKIYDSVSFFATLMGFMSGIMGWEIKLFSKKEYEPLF
jgi:hypothetical protein